MRQRPDSPLRHIPLVSRLLPATPTFTTTMRSVSLPPSPRFSLHFSPHLRDSLPHDSLTIFPALRSPCRTLSNRPVRLLDAPRPEQPPRNPRTCPCFLIQHGARFASPGASWRQQFRRRAAICNPAARFRSLRYSQLRSGAHKARATVMARC